jgi:hypothetical protein
MKGSPEWRAMLSSMGDHHSDASAKNSDSTYQDRLVAHYGPDLPGRTIMILGLPDRSVLAAAVCYIVPSLTIRRNQ